MKNTTYEVDENLQFAYLACRDNNAYTSKKTVVEILQDGIDSSEEDEIEFAYSVFPELR